MFPSNYATAALADRIRPDRRQTPTASEIRLRIKRAAQGGLTMLEQTFNTPLPLELEVGIPSGDIEIETVDGEESHIAVDGDERLLAEVEVTPGRQPHHRRLPRQGEVRLLAHAVHARLGQQPEGARHRPARRRPEDQDRLGRRPRRRAARLARLSTRSPGTSASAARSAATRR